MTQDNAKIKNKLEAFKANKELAQFVVTMNLEEKMGELVQAIKGIPTVEIPEQQEVSLSETNDLLQELVNKEIDLSPITNAINKVVDKVNEPINISVTLDIV